MATALWSALRQQLAGRPAEELLDLLRDLCERSADNRRFLAARLRGDDGASALEEYRARVLAEFAGAPARAPRLGTARKAIRDYRKATNDMAGTADLMLTNLESGTQLSREHGDMGEAYYGSLALVLRDLVALLRDAPGPRAALLPRLRALTEASRRVGWTWGDVVRLAVEEIE